MKRGLPHSDELWLVHWPRRPDGSFGPELAAREQLAAEAFQVNTCLRQLAIGVGGRPALDPAWLAGADVLSGQAAWRFMLEVATGLRSAVPGETNVFGQLRRAWAETPTQALARARLRPLVEAMFADARRIRALYLQGIGGNSYGSLARRLLAPAAGDPVLIVGAGELARSLAPFFADFPLGAWNHRDTTAVLPAGRHGLRWFAPEAAADAATWARHLIFTTPADDGHDSAWQVRLATSGTDGARRRVLHLGRNRRAAIAWAGEVEAFWLDDVFALARSQAERRTRQLAAAREACGAYAAERFAALTSPPARTLRLAHG